MAEPPWSQYDQAFKQIHDRIAEVLTKLDTPADPQTVEIIASIVLTVAQQSIERVLQKKGTPTSFNVTASGAVVAAPGAGKRLQLYGFSLLVLADEQARLRWGSATGDIIAGLPTKGVIIANLLGIDEKGGENQSLFLEKTGTGNAQGRVWTEAVNV